MSDETPTYKEYLGDSVYADFDGHHIVLTTENSDAAYPPNRIYLEPQVFNALHRYSHWLKDRLEQEAQKEEEKP